MLLKFNLLGEFHDIPAGLRNGFSLGSNHQLTSTFIPVNHKSALQNKLAVSSHIRKELSLNRYTGPFHPSRLQELIGPFQTSPIGVVPKSNGAFRIIQDMSFPRDSEPVPSVNSFINSDDFPCEWSSFAHCYVLVSRAPPGTQAAVFDVESAYRIIPVHPTDQPLCCIQFNDLIYIDHCLAFGCSSSCGIFGRVADALVAIFRAHSIDTILKWVDDFIFLRYPLDFNNEVYSYSFDEENIWTIARALGWPWSTSKHQPFHSTFTYLGFLWDINGRTVQLPETKIAKYRARLLPWLTASKATLSQSQKLLGTLSHCALVVPGGPSHLPSMFKFIATFAKAKSSFTQHSISQLLKDDILWWDTQFSMSFCGKTISEPSPPLPAKVFVDASTSWGIGVSIDGSWDAYKFFPNTFTDGRNIGWAEMVAVEICVYYIAQLYPHGSHIIIHSDNQGVLACVRNQCSRGRHTNSSIQRMSYFLLSHNLHITGQYVATDNNIADPISRGSFPSSSKRLLPTFSVPDALQRFLTRLIT